MIITRGNAYILMLRDEMAFYGWKREVSQSYVIGSNLGFLQKITWLFPFFL